MVAPVPNAPPHFTPVPGGVRRQVWMPPAARPLAQNPLEALYSDRLAHENGSKGDLQMTHPVSSGNANAFGLPLQQGGGGPQSPFSQFVRHVSPNPTPSKWDFYWDEFRANYSRSQEAGNERYKEELKRNKKSTLKLVFLTALAGLGFTAFRRLRRTFTYLMMLGLLSYPIMEANRTFPKLGEAYKQVQQGDPTKGRETFRKAMDDSVYSIFQGFFKPFSYGMLIALALSIPGGLLRKEGGFVENVIRKVFDVLRIPKDIMPIRMLDKIAKPVTEWGNGISNRIRKKIKWIDSLESA